MNAKGMKKILFTKKSRHLVRWLNFSQFCPPTKKEIVDDDDDGERERETEKCYFSRSRYRRRRRRCESH